MEISSPFLFPSHLIESKRRRWRKIEGREIKRENTIINQEMDQMMMASGDTLFFLFDYQACLDDRPHLLPSLFPSSPSSSSITELLKLKLRFRELGLLDCSFIHPFHIRSYLSIQGKVSDGEDVHSLAYKLHAQPIKIQLELNWLTTDQWSIGKER